MQSDESQFPQSRAVSELGPTSTQDEGTPATGPQGRRPEAASGAPPSNTAPGNSNEGGEDNVRLLLHGIDSLYVSFYGQLYKGKGNVLLRLKQFAQSPYDYERARALYSHGQHNFSVRSHGRGKFSYVLDNPCYHLWISSLTSEKLPLAYVQIKSEWLTHNGVKGAVDELIEIIETLGIIEEGPNVSRADLFVDLVSGLDFERIRRNDWVTRAKTIDDYGGSRQSTGFVFGRGGDLSARFYDKTIEILLSGKDYLRTLWSRNGWNTKDTVHRFEGQFHSAILRQFNITTVGSLLDNCGALWKYLTVDWLKLVVPNPEDDTRSRWPSHPVWRAIQATPWSSVGKVQRINATPERIPKDFYLVNRGISVLAMFMAAKGIDDPLEGTKEFYRLMKDYCQAKSWFEGADFDGIISERVRMKCRDYGLLHPVAKEQRDKVLAEDAAEAYRKERDGE